jgi:hypothetical protein
LGVKMPVRRESDEVMAKSLILGVWREESAR